MKKKIAAAIVMIVLSVTGYYCVHFWFGATPTSVLTKSLMQANAGDYVGACEHLPTGQREQLLEDPDRLRAAWDTITKNRTIAKINTTEDRGISGTFGDIDVIIHYQDGSTRSAKTTISYYKGKWTYGLRELHSAIIRANINSDMESRRIVLDKEFTRVGKSPVLLRVPEKLIWDSDKQDFDHPDIRIWIQLEPKPWSDVSFATLLKDVEKGWDSPTCELMQREDISTGEVKRILFDGESINEKGRGWRKMHLVIGQEAQAALINTSFPNLENYRRAMRESLMSARWERKKGAD